MAGSLDRYELREESERIREVLRMAREDEGLWDADPLWDSLAAIRRRSGEDSPEHLEDFLENWERENISEPEDWDLSDEKIEAAVSAYAAKREEIANTLDCPETSLDQDFYHGSDADFESLETTDNPLGGPRGAFMTGDYSTARQYAENKNRECEEENTSYEDCPPPRVYKVRFKEERVADCSEILDIEGDLDKLFLDSQGMVRPRESADAWNTRWERVSDNLDLAKAQGFGGAAMPTTLTPFARPSEADEPEFVSFYPGKNTEVVAMRLFDRGDDSFDEESSGWLDLPRGDRRERLSFVRTEAERFKERKTREKESKAYSEPQKYAPRRGRGGREFGRW